MEDWSWLDERVAAAGGCAGIVRTIHWHQRSAAAAADRYGTRIWARPAPPGVLWGSLDEPVTDTGLLPGGVIGHWLTNGDELALWLPVQQALVFGDAMIRDPEGALRRCPDSWVDVGHREPERLRADLHALIHLQPKHVLVSHGAAVLGEGPTAFERAAAGNATA